MGFMEKGTTMVAAIAVCAILILSVLVPVIADNNGTVERRTTLENEGTPVIMGDVAEEYNVQWDSALPGMVKINGSVTTVYFVAGPDATVSPDHKDVTVDLTYGELPVPVRTGYTFGGWFTSTEYTTEVTEDTVVVGVQDKTLYAKWTANTYTVTFDAMGGTVNPATKTVTFGQAYGELPEPNYTGHIFGGWFDANNNPISSASIVSIADNHTLHAVYTTEQYLVSFTTDGNGTVDVQNVTVDYGTAYTISGNTIVIDGTTVTATGTGSYVFDSWTPSTSGTITGATVFIASFSNPVTLTFAAQSPGSVDTQSLTVPAGTQYTVADNVITVVGETPVTASLPDGYYMIGWNIAQGVGTVTDAMTFTASYEEIEIAKVVCSNQTTWVLTTDGKLFGCGNDEYVQLGGITYDIVTSFTQCLSNETIASISCTDTTTWVVTTDGKLFGCGECGYGQQGEESYYNGLPFTQRLSNETIASVSCSQNTTWAVTTDGKLFGCGDNQYGQQGDGTTDNVTTFTQRLANETIASVSCSDQTTWAVTTDGKLFGCGNNANGQQSSNNYNDVTTFTQRLSGETIASLSCSNSTTWAVTTDGKLFGCGGNWNGQLGDNTGNDVTTFTRYLSTETIASVSCSQNTTWAVTTDGKLFGCGDNQDGQQGDGTTTNVTTFTQRLSTETIASLSCSNSTTWALTTDGKLFGCGYNNGNQSDGLHDGMYNNITTFTQRLTTETIASVSCSDNTTWALTTDRELFGCGQNYHGQQGDDTGDTVGTFTQRIMPGAVYIKVTATFSAQSPGSVDTAQINVPVGTQFTVSDNTVTFAGIGTVTASLPDGYYMTGWNVPQGSGIVTGAMTFTAQYEAIEIAKISASGSTTWIVTADGKLFGCGYNYNGQQGDGTTTNVSTFTQRLSTETIASVSCSASTTWVVTTDGKLFGCGSNIYGQQGNGTTNNVTTFTQRLNGESIASVSCSENTTWAVTTDGKLFGCGYNNAGQQGNGTSGSGTNVTTFTQRLSTETIADVVCSEMTTWAITTDGKLYGCGRNNYGQQGDGTTNNVTTFTQRLDTETIADVVCSTDTTWALTTDGKLYGCGRNNNGHQGDGTTTNVMIFTQRLSEETVADVVCSTNTTWVITTDGKLFGCGKNSNGQQGDGTTTNVTTFTQRLSGETIASLSCSNDTTWVVTTDGKLFGCGKNSNGQQGNNTSGNGTDVTTFTQRLTGETVASVSCSVGTTWALTTDGELFGCGYNYYRQQGDGTANDVTTFTQRGPPGTVNISQIGSLSSPVPMAGSRAAMVPLNNPNLNPLSPAIQPLSINASMVGTEYTWHMGGNDWMLCTVSTGQDQYALALFYAGAASPLLWENDVTLVFSNGTLSGENDGTPFTMTYTSIFYKGNGNYVLMGESAYVKDDTNIIGYAVPTDGNGLMVKGTVASLTAENIGGIIVVGDAAATTSETDYADVSSLSGLSASYNTDQTAACSTVIVPKTVTATETVENEVMANILSIIPIVLMVGLMLAVVGTVLYKRM